MLSRPMGDAYAAQAISPSGAQASPRDALYSVGRMAESPLSASSDVAPAPPQQQQQQGDEVAPGAYTSRSSAARGGDLSTSQSDLGGSQGDLMAAFTNVTAYATEEYFAGGAHDAEIVHENAAAPAIGDYGYDPAHDMLHYAPTTADAIGQMQQQQSIGSQQVFFQEQSVNR